jgi:hypothetical protein
MKTMKNTKGQMRVIETILASFIFFSALTFANMLAVLPLSQKYESSDLEKMGHNVFHELDEKGVLSRFVYNETEWAELALALMIVFQPDVYFDLTIYEAHTQDSPINQDFPIRFGAPEVFATSDSTASISYILPGQQTEYNPRILILQLVRG